MKVFGFEEERRMCDILSFSSKNREASIPLLFVFLQQSGILNDLSAQPALPLLDNFSYVFDTDEREH